MLSKIMAMGACMRPCRPWGLAIQYELTRCRVRP